MAATYDPYPTVPLSKFHDELAFEFQMLNQPLFDYYIKQVARDMATSQPILRRNLDVKLEPCVKRYSVESPDGLDVEGIMDARHVRHDLDHGSRKLRRLLAAPEHTHILDWITWWDKDEKVAHIHIPPQECLGHVHFVLMVAPSRDACELPKVYYDEWLPIVVMGVKSRLLLLTGRPWTNVRAGAEYSAAYSQMLADVAVEKAMHGQVGMVRMRHGLVL